MTLFLVVHINIKIVRHFRTIKKTKNCDVFEELFNYTTILTPGLNQVSFCVATRFCVPCEHRTCAAPKIIIPRERGIITFIRIIIIVNNRIE